MFRELYQPGSSSMLGLFQELGPCLINNQSTGVDLNPTSWNEYANVYVSIIPNFICDS
jgi:carboxypeptidase C (cathepsin A)